MVERHVKAHPFALTVLAGATSLCAARHIEGQVAPSSWSNVPAQATAGVTHRTFRSAALGTDVGYSVLLPPDYARESRRYPVLYWLHGRGGDENSPVGVVAPGTLSAMTNGTLPPFIIVFVNGGPATFYADSPDGGIPVETMLIDELIPHVDATYRTLPNQRGRAIEGMSMGGHGALTLAMKHSSLFGSVVAYAPALLDVKSGPDGALTLSRAATFDGDPPETERSIELNLQTFHQMFGADPAIYSQHSPWSIVPRDASALRDVVTIRFVIGTADPLFASNELLHDLMLAHDYDHEYLVLQDIAHSLRPLYERVGLDGLRFHARVGSWQ
jgi:S-formylglutathione hydrolase FrmB